MRFEYDERKNQLNLRKHRVDFETAEIVFEDPCALTQRDELHGEEERFITLGEVAPRGRYLCRSHGVCSGGWRGSHPIDISPGCNKFGEEIL